MEIPIGKKQIYTISRSCSSVKSSSKSRTNENSVERFFNQLKKNQFVFVLSVVETYASQTLNYLTDKSKISNTLLDLQQIWKV